MAERVVRVSDATDIKLRETVGRIQLLALSMPKDGRSFSLTENSMISIVPSQKLGIETAASAVDDESVSIQVYRLTADMMPNGMPRHNEYSVHSAASFSVVGNLLAISHVIGMRVV